MHKSVNEAKAEHLLFVTFVIFQSNKIHSIQYSWQSYLSRWE